LVLEIPLKTWAVALIQGNHLALKKMLPLLPCMFGKHDKSA
jgi:hypothetical protein